MRLLRVLVWKYLVHTFTNRLLLLMSVGMPLFLVLLIQFAFGNLVWGRGIPDVAVPVGVVNLDRGAKWGNAGQILVDLLNSSKTPGASEDLPLPLFEVSYLPSEDQAKKLVDQGELVAAVIIPPDFSVALENEKAVVQTYIYDPYIFRGEAFRNFARTLANMANTAEIAVRTAVEGIEWDPVIQLQIGAGLYDAILQDRVLSATDLDAYPVSILRMDNKTSMPQIELTRYLAAGIAVLFTGFWGLIGAASLHQEKTRGTLQRMFLTPNPPNRIVLGTILGVYLGSLLRLGILASGIFISERLAALPNANSMNWIGLLFLAVALVSAASGFGVLIAGLARTYTQAANYGRGLLIIMGLVGGVFFPVEPTSGVLSILAPMTFQYWALHGYQKLLLGVGVSQIWQHLVILSGMGILFFLAGSFLMRRKMAYA